MRILLDNNIPVRFADALVDFDVTHVKDVGLDAVLDEPLLDAIDGQFDILVTWIEASHFSKTYWPADLQ